MFTVCSQMQKVIANLVVRSFGTDSFEKAESALRELRSCCAEKEPALYNEWIVEFRNNLFERGKKVFWDKIVKGELYCPLEWMDTGLPPTIPTTYPSKLQSISNLTNSFLIPFGMYMYSITYPLILITSPATILNLPINLFCPLDSALVLTSDNFHSIFSLHPLHSFLSCNSPSGTFPKLSHGAIFTMCSHTFTLFWSRKTPVIVKIFQLSFHVFVCAFRPEIPSFFSKSFLFLFLFFYYIVMRAFCFFSNMMLY